MVPALFPTVLLHYCSRHIQVLFHVQMLCSNAMNHKLVGDPHYKVLTLIYKRTPLISLGPIRHFSTPLLTHSLVSAAARHMGMEAEGEGRRRCLCELFCFTLSLNKKAQGYETISP